jgi:hypothetical protein
MGICLRYQSIGVPDKEIKKKIMEEADQLYDNYEWWGEGMYFLGLYNDGEPIHGIPKLFAFGYGYVTKEKQQFTMVDGGEDAFMAARDLSIMVKHLFDWSKRYGVEWQLDHGGEYLGDINSEAIGQGILDFINALVEPIGIPLDDPIAESKAREIFDKYEDR